MSKDYKAQCGSKQILIDSFESNGIPVQVYVSATKQSVKQYCKDTQDKKTGMYWLTFKEGLTRLYRNI